VLLVVIQDGDVSGVDYLRDGFGQCLKLEKKKCLDVPTQAPIYAVFIFLPSFTAGSIVSIAGEITLLFLRIPCPLLPFLSSLPLPCHVACCKLP